MNTKLELNNSKLKTEQLKIAYGDNSKLKIQNCAPRNNSKLKIQNSKLKIMAINLKAKETLQQIGEYKGKYRYVLGTEIYNRLSEAKVIQEAALRSGVSRGVMQACWDAAGDVIKAWATEGHSVAIPGLGTMRLGVRAKSVATVNDVASGIITSRRVIFTPNPLIKRELAETSINITCYDRNGNVVKKVTSGDDGTIDDPENDPNGGTGTPGGSNPSGTDSKPGGAGSAQEGGGSSGEDGDLGSEG